VGRQLQDMCVFAVNRWFDGVAVGAVGVVIVVVAIVVWVLAVVVGVWVVVAVTYTDVVVVAFIVFDVAAGTV
jgi:hypothetical protein